MSLIRWFTKNWANTREPTHADLAPLVLPVGITDAIEHLKRSVGGLPRWRVEGTPKPAELHLTRRTRTLRFVDDVVLTFEPAAGGTRIHARSRSRLGKGDLGQNRRNILELWKEIRSRIEN